MSHLWTNGFPSSLKVVRKLYGSGSREDVWPLDTPKKPGHNCIFQTFFNNYGTFPKTTVQTNTNLQHRLSSNFFPAYSKPPLYVRNPPSYCHYIITAYHTNYSQSTKWSFTRQHQLCCEH
jgi:hypothetical protein